MLTWKYLLMSSGFGMILAAASILAYDLYRTFSRKGSASAGGSTPQIARSHWRVSLALALLAWGPILVAVSMVLMTAATGGLHLSYVVAVPEHRIE
jgi:hypothetical protein